METEKQFDLDLFTREAQSNAAYEKIKTKKVLIAGCGNVGSVLATILAESGIPEMILIDFDDYSYTDNRQLYSTEESVGKNKAIITALEVTRRAPCYARPYNGNAVTLLRDNIIRPTGYDIFLCVDSVQARKDIVHIIKEKLCEEERGKILDVGVERNAIQIANYKNKSPDDLYKQDNGHAACVTIPLASFKAFEAAAIMAGAYFALYETEGSDEDEPMVPYDHALQIYTNTMTTFKRKI